MTVTCPSHVCHIMSHDCHVIDELLRSTAELVDVLLECDEVVGRVE